MDGVSNIGEGRWLEPLPLGDSGHKGDFGEQFVQALACAANLNVGKSRDRLGFDWELTYPGRSGNMKQPKIVAQVKCWSRPGHVKADEDHWHYPLRVRNFNLLSGRDWYDPRFLFLVVVPEDMNQWIDVDHEGLLLRYAAYWACFHDCAPLEGRHQDSKVPVVVPKANLLTIPALHNLFVPEFRDKLEAR
ncbi:DUF4365 domain-containing protein [Streptomyces sp. NPDC003077]|uniref:DUF4365 domain-containing protein n=1 Tax=Streptomyces sp. NPDC003077 TaxID=3154443 RepID=UPI0033B7DA22